MAAMKGERKRRWILGWLMLLHSWASVGEIWNLRDEDEITHCACVFSGRVDCSQTAARNQYLHLYSGNEKAEQRNDGDGEGDPVREGEAWAAPNAPEDFIEGKAAPGRSGPHGQGCRTNEGSSL
jgi:hypothetical protein